MIFSSDDIKAIIEPFSVTVIANKGTAAEYSFAAVFDNPKKVFLDDFTVTESEPSLTCRTVDVSALSQGKTVFCNGITYKVRENFPDGTGVTVLSLMRVTSK